MQLSKNLLSITSLLAAAATVRAHGGVVSMSVGDTQYTGWSPYNSPDGQVTAERPYSSYNPILDPEDPTMHCNDDGTAGPGQQTITMAAGETIRAVYPQWTHAEGPYTVYLADCGGSCDSVNSASLKWFKIYELGLVSGTLADGVWANGQLMADLYWDTTIPSNLKAGNYMIRWETLALHQANTPQFYPECAQLQVTGGGDVFPTDDYIVPIPGAWGANDPGVMVDIYSAEAASITTYAIPGPRVFPDFAGYAPPPNLPAEGNSPAPSSSAGGSSPSSTATAPGSPSSTQVAQQYQQCGGIGYTGATTCASPYTCQKSSDYYSQCL